MKSSIRLIFIVTLFLCSSLWSASTQIFFSPNDQMADRLISLIDKEEEQILAAVFCLTHREIADALIRAKRRGVNVEVIVDPFSLKSRMAVAKLQNAHVKLSVWDASLIVPDRNAKVARKRKRRPLMHDKFCVFGGRTVWTGSYNFTYDATYFHRENVILIEDAEIAALYEKEFYNIKGSAVRPYEEYLTAHPKRKKNVMDAVKRR